MVVCIPQGNILPKDLAPVVFQLRVDTVWEASLSWLLGCTATPKYAHSPAYFVHSGLTPGDTAQSLGVAQPYFTPHNPGLTQQGEANIG